MRMVSYISGMEDKTDVLEAPNSESSMDQYLQSIGLYRKPVAKDGSCLFRAVAEKIYLTQARHLDVRKECIQFMKMNSEHFREFVPGSFEHHLFDLQNPKEWAGQVEITALSMLYKHDFIVYQEVNQPPQYVTANGFKDKIELCFSNGNHYDFIYPKSFKEDAAIVQSTLYHYLYDTVFPNCESIDNKSTATAGDSKAEDFNKRDATKSAHDKEVQQSLDPTVYRNVALEVWENSKQDQASSDKLLASKLQYRTGEYCMLSMSEATSADDFKVRIDSICEDSLTCHVWIPELQQTTSVSIERLRPLLEKPEKIAQIAYNELPGFYNKSDESAKDQPGNFQYPKKKQKISATRGSREDENRGKRFDPRSDARGEGKQEGRGDGTSNRRDNRRDRRGRGDRNDKNLEKRGRLNEKGNKKSDSPRVTSPPAVATKTETKSQVNEKMNGARKPVDQEGASQESGRSVQEYPSLKGQEKEKTAKQHESSAAFWQRMRETNKSAANAPEGLGDVNEEDKENAPTENSLNTSAEAYEEIYVGGARSGTEQGTLHETEFARDAAEVKNPLGSGSAAEVKSNAEHGLKATVPVAAEASSVEQEASAVTRTKSSVPIVRGQDVKPKGTAPNVSDAWSDSPCTVDKNSFNVIETSKGTSHPASTADIHASKTEQSNVDPENRLDTGESSFDGVSGTHVEVGATVSEGGPYFSTVSKVSFPSGFDELVGTDGRYVVVNEDASTATGSPITFMSQSDISAASDESGRLDVTNPDTSSEDKDVITVDHIPIAAPAPEQSRSDLRNENRIRILKKNTKERPVSFNSSNESSSSIEQSESVSRERSPEPDSRKTQGKKVSFGEVKEIPQSTSEQGPYVDPNMQAMAPEMAHNPYANANGLTDPSEHPYYEDSVGMGAASMGMPAQMMPVMMHNPMAPQNESFHVPQGFSVDPEGKDLPNHIPTLQFFFNLGLQYFYLQHQTPAFINMPMQQMSTVQMQPPSVQGHISSPMPTQRFATGVDPTSHFSQEQVLQPQQDDFVTVSSAPAVLYDYIPQPSLSQSRQHHSQAGHQNNASHYEQPPRMRRARGRGVQPAAHLSMSRGYNMYNQPPNQHKLQNRMGKRGGFNTGSAGSGQTQLYQY